MRQNMPKRGILIYYSNQMFLPYFHHIGCSSLIEKMYSTLRTFAFSIIPLIFFPSGSSPEIANSWRLETFSHQILKYEDPDFGGLSGISMSSDGNRFVAISDRAIYFEGEMIRNNAKKLIGITILGHGKILNSKGKELSGKNVDSESIVRSPEKGYYISFESNNRIMFHNTLSSPGKFLPKHPDFNKLKFNDGIEAIAINETGHVFAIPELPPKGHQKHPIYKLEEQQWFVLNSLKISDGFKITDAEFIDDQNLILVERKFTFLDGFQIRLRRILFEKDEIKSIQVLLESDPWDFYNLEGLSKWKDEHGNIYLTLISDNQFSPLLKTEIREFLLVK